MENMLVKSLKKYCDAHLHLTQIPDFNLEMQQSDCIWYGASSCHSKEEWNQQKNINLPANFILLHTFGLHPQSAGEIDINENLSFLEQLIQSNTEENKIINAIGETGFDFFTKEFTAQEKKQEIMFNSQVELAVKYQLPVIIHGRKAMDKFFENKNQLKKVPSVLFHSFMGNSIQAKSMLSQGINCYFSFGKQMNNNNKKVIDCVKNLPLENLLLETDAPYQFLRNETYTKLMDIALVYNSTCELRQINLETLEDQMEKNFKSLFLI